MPLGDAFETETAMEEVFGMVDLDKIFDRPSRAVHAEMPFLAVGVAAVDRNGNHAGNYIAVSDALKRVRRLEGVWHAPHQSARIAACVRLTI